MTFQGNKHYLLLAPQSLSSSATATAVLDCRGWGEAQISVLLGAGAATHAPATLSLAESDTTAQTDFVAISAFATSNLAAAVLTTSAATAVGAVLNVDLRGRKRYLRCSVTPNTSGTGLVSVVAQLSRGKESASSNAEAGVNAMVNG